MVVGYGQWVCTRMHKFVHVCMPSVCVSVHALSENNRQNPRVLSILEYTYKIYRNVEAMGNENVIFLFGERGIWEIMRNTEIYAIFFN